MALHRRAPATIPAVVATAVLLAGGCAADTDRLPSPVGGIDVTSPAFREGGTIPVEHTCDGDDVPPPLALSGVPAEADEILVVVEDPDAPGGTFTHWLVWGLPPDLERLERPLPEGATEGRNDFDEDGWRGPCPPPEDDEHRYRFHVYALDAPLALRPGASAEDVREALEGVVADGVLVGRYGR